MRATTMVPVKAFVQPGDEIATSRAEVHDVFKVMHSGYGFAGVLLTQRPTESGKGMRYALWVVTTDGKIRATMTTDDFPAVSAAFLARVTEKVQETGMGELTV